MAGQDHVIVPCKLVGRKHVDLSSSVRGNAAFSSFVADGFEASYVGTLSAHRNDASALHRAMLL